MEELYVVSFHAKCFRSIKMYLNSVNQFLNPEEVLYVFLSLKSIVPDGWALHDLWYGQTDQSCYGQQDDGHNYYHIFLE